jgi:hypothetical protein
MAYMIDKAYEADRAYTASGCQPRQAVSPQLQPGELVLTMGTFRPARVLAVHDLGTHLEALVEWTVDLERARFRLCWLRRIEG